MKKKPHVIGSRELISLPEYGLHDIPVKVDTGADYSSIWASNVQESEGELSFYLFNKNSKFYTGEKLTMKEYGVTRVKNSFGHMEDRYKVKLSTVIAGRKIKVEFRLADRGSNKYPILIGKNTIRRRFLVDVNVNNRLGKHGPSRVLVLNSLPSAKVEEFFANVNRVNKKIACEFYTYDDLLFTISPTQKLTIQNIHTGESLHKYDLIYFKTYFKRAEHAAAVAEYAAMRSIPFLDEEVLTYHARTKLTQYIRLANNKVPVPASLLMSYKFLSGRYDLFVKTLGTPFILKDVAAEQGEANFLIKNEAQFEKAATLASKEKIYFIGQKFIQNDGDYRFIIFDKTIALILKRTGQGESHLNNTSKGGSSETCNADSLPSRAKSLATKAAIIMNRQVAGVDLIQDKHSGLWYILEVNNSPQLSYGGAMQEKVMTFAKFLQKYIDK